MAMGRIYKTKRQPIVKARKKRVNRRNRRRRMRSNITVFPTSGFPPAIYTKLNYSGRITLSTNGTTISYHSFRINSLFDPDYTSTGTQPYARDQFAEIYDYYRVYGCKVTLMITLPTSSSYSVLFTTRASSDNVAIADIDAETERYRSMRTMIAAGQTKTITQYFDMRKVLGKSKTQYERDDTAMGTNPLEAVYLYLSALATTGTPDLAVWVKFTMYSKIYGVQDFVPS